MNKRRGKYLTLGLLMLLGFAAHIHTGKAHETENSFRPAIPKTWDDQAMAALEVPLADPAGSPVHISIRISGAASGIEGNHTRLAPRPPLFALLGPPRFAI